MPRAPLPPRARLLLPIFLVALVGLSAWRLRQRRSEVGAPPDGPLIELAGQAMGTTYSVKLVRASAGKLSRRDAHGAVRRVLEGIEASMSTYREDSELSRFNRSDGARPVAVSRDLRRVLQVALDVGHRSGGALDVTVGPLVDLWGFGPAPRAEAGRGAPVDVGALQALARHVGQDKLRLGPEGLSKADPAVRVDLSAVAKGYAVDRVAAALQELGAVDLLVEVGGELTARGGRPGGEPWRVGIERPVSQARSIERVLPLRDRGLATSGDYRNFYEKDGKRLSHLIDPRSGRPVEHGLASVSVVHPRVAVADAWATALSVLGPQQGPRVAEAQGLSALFIVRLPDGGFRTDVTPAFAAAFPE